MPLARIFTHHPERTAALSSQLQQQGYTVEVASPNQANLPPADLEIEFEVCERADVLERAAGLADQLQADIAVAPGVMQSEAPIIEDIPVHTAAVEPQIAVKSERELAFEEAFAASSELPAVSSALSAEEQISPEIDVPVMERAPLPPVAFADEPFTARPVMNAEVVKPADPVPYLAQLTPFGKPQIEAETQNASLRIETPAIERPGTEKPAERESAQAPIPQVPAADPAQPTIWKRGAVFTAKAVANARAIASSTVESFREQSHEYQMKAKIRSAEARAAHEARLLDLEQRRADAAKRASELEEARAAASARLLELVRQRDPGLHEQNKSDQALAGESSPVIERKTVPVAAASSRPAARPSGNDTWWHAAMAVVAKKNRKPMSPQLRAVLMGAGAITALFVVGIVLGSLYPRTPLAQPSAQSTSKAQSSSASSQSGGVTLKASGPSTQASSTAKPSPASTAAIAKTETSAAQEKPSPRYDQTRRIAAQQGEENLGDDVVIRHYQRPVPTEKPKQSGQQAVLKHFSDMQN